MLHVNCYSPPTNQVSSQDSLAIHFHNISLRKHSAGSTSGNLPNPCLVRVQFPWQQPRSLMVSWWSPVGRTGDASVVTVNRGDTGGKDDTSGTSDTGDNDSGQAAVTTVTVERLRMVLKTFMKDGFSCVIFIAVVSLKSMRSLWSNVDLRVTGAEQYPFTPGFEIGDKSNSD